MKDLQYLKVKIAKEKRKVRSISLPISLWERYDDLAREHELNLSNVVEEALRNFDAELTGSITVPQGATDVPCKL
jgi:hypothetical protein